MKASELPEVSGAPHFFVRGPYSWGRGPTVADAIRAAQVRHMQIVHVCRIDTQGECEPISGELHFSKRGDIWEGRVWGKDISLKKITHQARLKVSQEGRSSANL